MKSTVRVGSNEGVGKRLLTAREAASYLGLAEETVYRKARLRELPSVKVGRSLRKGVDQDLPGSAQFGVTGFTNLGTGGWNPNLANSQARQLINDTTVTRGKHSIKFGTNISWLQRNLANPRQASGIFNFNGNFSRDPMTQTGGEGLADLLLGISWGTDVANRMGSNLRAPWSHFYIQDEWRATRKLTLNLGVRYELDLPYVDKHDNLSWFDTDLAVPQMIVAEPSSRSARAVVPTDKNNFGPRFGFAYQVRPTTVLRGGYGVYYANFDTTDVPGFNPPFHIWIQILTDSIHPEFFLEDGVPDRFSPENISSVAPSARELRPLTGIGQQWNLTVQHELARDWLLEVGYFGNKGNHLFRRWNANYALPGPGNISERRRITSMSWPATDIVVSPLGRVLREQYDGNSLFHSLQAKLEKRLSGGLSLLGSYIFSKTIGDVCGHAVQGNAPGCAVKTR